MNLKELGESLKNERERQGLSLGDVVEKTKISRANIDHIESGNLDDLPHPVYVKGFIKNYASYLGLNSQEYSKIFEDNINSDEDRLEEEVSDAVDYFESEEESRKARKWTIISVVLTIILLCILGWLVYDLFLANSPSKQSNISVQDKSSQPGPTVQQGKKSENSDLKGNKEEGSSLKKTTNGSSENSSIAKQKRVGLLDQTEQESSMTSIEKNIQNTTLRLEMNAEGIAKKNASTENISTIKQNMALENSTTTNKTSEKKLNSNTLHIFAFEACWMEAHVDNNSKQIFLRPGESVKFRFQDQVKVKLGNAGGVTLKYNKKIYPLEAESGQVKTMIFPPE